MIDSWSPLWSSIVRSSLWRDTKDAKILFVTMLALRDADGTVYGKLHWLADQAKLSVDETKEALRILSSPDRQVDEDDAEQPYDGRRIERVEDDRGQGWKILNHDKYKRLMKEIATRNRKAAWARNRRQEEIDAAIAARKAAKAANQQRLNEARTHADLGGTPEKHSQAGKLETHPTDPPWIGSNETAAQP